MPTGLAAGALRSLAAGALIVGASCADGGGPASGAAGEPVDVVPRPPARPLVPGELPAGFRVSRVAVGDEDPRQSRALLLGPAGRDPAAVDAPLVVAGSSSGSASIAGPYDVPRRTVDDLGVDGPAGSYVAYDGPWTWVVFNAEMDCYEDCLDYVAGRGIDDDDLVAIARATDFGDARPQVDPAALPGDLVPLATVPPADGVRTSGVARVDIEADGRPGAGLLTVQMAEADPWLAALWGFWVDGEAEPRGHPGRAGRAGATIEEADAARMWVEGGTLVTVLGWGVDDATMDAVVDGLRPGTPADLVALQDEMDSRPITAADVGCVGEATILSGPTGVPGWRWAVGLGTTAESPGRVATCTTLVGAEGSAGGTGSAGVPLAPVGELTVLRGSIGGTAVDGMFVIGAAPPGTATVEVLAPSGDVVVAELADAGPRSSGERWFAAFLRGATADAGVVARDATETEIAWSDPPAA